MDDEKITRIAAKILRIPPEDVILTRLAGDASARRFFRLTFPPRLKNKNMILVAFPAGDSDVITRYIRMSDCLRKAGIAAPEIYHMNGEGEQILMEDCGDQLLQNAVGAVNRVRLLALYQEAIDELILMQEQLRPELRPECPAWKSVFDEEKFLWELNFFLKHTVEGYYHRRISGADRGRFKNYFLQLCREILPQPRVFCHRDYHSRNLLLQNGKIRVVDFQDARLGPYTYDLVSLLQDPYAGLAPGVKEELKDYYLGRKPKFLDKIFSKRFERDFAMMTVQRILKAAGTFGYMFEEKGKKEYVKYLPAAFGSARNILSEYPKFSGLLVLLEKYCNPLKLSLIKKPLNPKDNPDYSCLPTGRQE